MAIDRCMCGGVGGFFEEEYPFIRQGVMHSPLGCLRGERRFDQLRAWYYEITGFEYYGQDLAALFQALMSALARNPEIAKDIEGLVLSPVPCSPVKDYVPSEEKPRGNKGSRVGSTTPRVYRDPSPAPWVPASGVPKPPWEK